MKNVTERIKTFEDALRETGLPNTPDFNNVPEEMREFFKAIYQITVITKALNEGWFPNWNNINQRKWYPWFRMSSGCFVIYGANYVTSLAGAGYATRLCFPTEELAEYAGRQFIDIYSKIILK